MRESRLWWRWNLLLAPAAAQFKFLAFQSFAHRPFMAGRKYSAQQPSEFFQKGLFRRNPPIVGHDAVSPILSEFPHAFTDKIAHGMECKTAREIGCRCTEMPFKGIRKPTFGVKFHQFPDATRLAFFTHFHIKINERPPFSQRIYVFENAINLLPASKYAQVVRKL